jgi:hypothetical protein
MNKPKEIAVDSKWYLSPLETKLLAAIQKMMADFQYHEQLKYKNHRRVK